MTLLLILMAKAKYTFIFNPRPKGRGKISILDYPSSALMIDVLIIKWFCTLL